MDVDHALAEVGSFGYYQKKLLFLFITPVTIFNAIQICQLVLTGAQPDFSCQLSKFDIRPGYCGTETHRCPKYVYNNNFTSIATEWDLVCGSAYLIGLATTYTMAGILLGAPFAGWAADRFGRLRIFAPMMALTVIFTLLSPFTRSYYQFVSVRFVIGLLIGGESLVSFVLTTEFLGAKYRAFASIVLSASFAIGLMIYALVGYFIRDWRTLSLVVTLPGILFLLYYRLLLESPAWLNGKKRHGHLMSVLKRISQENNTSKGFEKLSNEKQSLIEQLTIVPSSKITTNHNLFDLFRYKSLRKITLVQCYIWCVNGCVYYGLTMSAGGLGRNIYISLCLSGLVEIPSYFIASYLLSRLGRRLTLNSFMLLGGAACAVMLFLPKDHENVEVGFALLGKMSISASFAVIYVQAAELYPTVIRNLAIGMCSMSARIGGMAAPMIASLGMVHHNLQFLVFGVMTVGGGLLGFLLEETLNRPLPDSIKELTLENEQELRPMDKVKLIQEAIEDENDIEMVI